MYKWGYENWHTTKQWDKNKLNHILPVLRHSLHKIILTKIGNNRDRKRKRDQLEAEIQNTYRPRRVLTAGGKASDSVKQAAKFADQSEVVAQMRVEVERWKGKCEALEGRLAEKDERIADKAREIENLTAMVDWLKHEIEKKGEGQK